MKTFIKYFLLLAISTNLLAMDDADHDGHINLFLSEDAEAFTIANGLWLGFGESAPDECQLRTSETQSPTPPDSVEPARKARRTTSPAASASSSSTSAASSTDVSAPSSTGASCSSADDDPLQYCKPLPVHCPWPGCSDHDTYFSPPFADISGLTKLRRHIRIVHKPKHESDGFRCPHTDSKKSFGCHGKLAEHLLSHKLAAAFQCNICAEEKTFNAKQTCERHVQRLHKKAGTYSCNCNARSSTYSGWCGHIQWCQKIEERMKLNRYFWCPCGDACTKEEALRHVKLCARARDGMVYVDSEKHVASTHDECMKLLSELERTSDSSADATSASSSSANASPTPDTAPSGEK